MKRVLECKVSLMEKDVDFSLDNEGKGNYIIRSSATFLPEKYIEQNPEYKEAILDSDESYLDFVSQAVSLMTENLKEETKDKKIDSIGIWVTFEDDKKVESSMDLSVMETIKEFHQDINPFLEFAKMTLHPFYESEVSE